MDNKIDDDPDLAAAIAEAEEIAEARGQVYEVDPTGITQVARDAKRGTSASRFKVEYIEQARKLCAKGWTDAEIAEFFEIHVMTLYRWKGLNPAFGEAVKAGKVEADERVQESLYRLACGYDKRVEKVFHSDGNITRAEVIEHVPPNVKAAHIWLLNRDAANWKNRQEITGKNGAPLNGPALPQRSTVEIARRTMFILNRAEDEQRGAPRTLLVEETVKETVER